MNSKYDSKITMEDLLASDLKSLSTSASSVGISSASPFSYRTLMANASNLSFSNLQVFESCPRRFELDKLTATEERERIETNVDFVFGHAIAAGIQSYLISHNKEEAQKQLIFAWNAELLLEKPKSKKSIWEALTALDVFISSCSEFLSDWEVATIKGRPAVELSFSINLENDYTFYGHVDIILRNKESNQLAVLEVKTSGSYSIYEENYRHSPQALGYTIILDQIAVELGISANFTVYYLVYKTMNREFEVLPFFKTYADKAHWLQSLILSCNEITSYRKIGFFPKRVQGCYNYYRRCPYYDVCTMSNKALTPYENIGEIQMPSERILPEFSYNFSDLIKLQQILMGGPNHDF